MYTDKYKEVDEAFWECAIKIMPWLLTEYTNMNELNQNTLKLIEECVTDMGLLFARPAFGGYAMHLNIDGDSDFTSHKEYLFSSIQTKIKEIEDKDRFKRRVLFVWTGQDDNFRKFRLVFFFEPLNTI